MNTGPPSAAVTGDRRAARVPVQHLGQHARRPRRSGNNDGPPIDYGVKFRSDVDGTITGFRFYKGPGDTGTHTGHL